MSVPATRAMLAKALAATVLRRAPRDRRATDAHSFPGCFRGGLILAEHARGGGVIRDISLPRELVYPLVNYRREPLKAQVRLGQVLRGGEPVAAGVLAGSSGVVSEIAERACPHPSGRAVPAVVIATDGRDEVQTLPPLPALSIARVAAAGVHGLGGAGFPLHEKLISASGQKLPLLLINAVECEPGNTGDSALILQHSEIVVDGIVALVALTGAERCLIAVKDNEPAIVEALEAAVARAPEPRPAIAAVPARYPAGAERTLLRLLTGRAPAPGERPADIGALCINVATACAAGQARHGEPMLSRIVTLTGEGMPRPAAVRVRIGTPITHLLADTGNARLTPGTRLFIGGPLSGFELTDPTAPVLATTHSLHGVRTDVTGTVTACIRCGACADVCPERLLPQELYRHARQGSEATLSRLRIDDCIACGCCDQVCPARLPLTASFRHAADRCARAARARGEAERLAGRFAAHSARAADRQAAREAEITRHKAALGERDKAIATALARVRARRRSGG